MAESDNILTKLQDLLVYLIPQLNKFPLDQKFVLGDRIETKLLDVQEFCLRAYYSREKRGHLLEANLQLEVARHLVRLANALKLFSNHTYGVLAEKMDEVGRMIGGWLKSVSGARGTTTASADATPAPSPSNLRAVVVSSQNGVDAIARTKSGRNSQISGANARASPPDRAFRVRVWPLKFAPLHDSYAPLATHRST